MNWHLEPAEIIGIDIPLSSAMIVAVYLNVNVIFPDALTGVHVYPELYYRVYGEGVNDAPRLIHTDATQGTTLTLDAGTVKLRVYLSYNAKVGANGTLARDVLSKSVMTLTAVTPTEFPALGEQVFNLNLKSDATRVTMAAGTTLDWPAVLAHGPAMAPTAAVNTFMRLQGANMEFWTEIVLAEPAEHELFVKLLTYSAVPSPTALVTASNVITLALGQTSIAASEAGITAYGLKTGQLPILVSDGTSIATQALPTDPAGGWVVPVGTTAILLKHQITAANYTANIAPIIDALGQAYFYFVLRMTKKVYVTGFAGPNERIPHQTYIKAVFAGVDASTRPWTALLP